VKILKYLPVFYSNEKKSKNAAFKRSFNKSMRDQMAKLKLTDLEKAAKEECLYRNLYAYLEACVRFEAVFLFFKEFKNSVCMLTLSNRQY
jgi:hypothetical protein